MGIDKRLKMYSVNGTMEAIDPDEIKGAAEGSRKDVEGVIQALEGANLKNSIGHPQGDKIIRKEDHSGILDHYISRIEKGRFEVKKRIPKEDLAKQLPVRHELNKMPA